MSALGPEGSEPSAYDEIGRHDRGTPEEVDRLRRAMEANSSPLESLPMPPHTAEELGLLTDEHRRAEQAQRGIDSAYAALEAVPVDPTRPRPIKPPRHPRDY